MQQNKTIQVDYLKKILWQDTKTLNKRFNTSKKEKESGKIDAVKILNVLNCVLNPSTAESFIKEQAADSLRVKKIYHIQKSREVVWVRNY